MDKDTDTGTRTPPKAVHPCTECNGILQLVGGPSGWRDLRHVWRANKLGGGDSRQPSGLLSFCLNTHTHEHTQANVSNNRLQLKVIRTPFSWAPLQDSPALPADPTINSLAQLKPTPCCCYCPEIHKRTPINAQLKAKRIPAGDSLDTRMQRVRRA